MCQLDAVQKKSMPDKAENPVTFAAETILRIINLI